MFRIGILDRIISPDLEDEILNSVGIVICYNASNEQDLPNSISDLDAIIVYNKITLSDVTINKLQKCKIIVKAGVGYDNIDILAAGNAGIPVVNVPDYGTNDVADHTFALFLSYVKKICLYNDATQHNLWIPGMGRETHRLYGQNFGIIGMGRIGTSVAIRAKAFGMEVAYYDPYLPDGYEKTYQITKYSNIQELVEKSNIITIHTPLNQTTEELLNYSVLKFAKHKPILINTARGRLVKFCDVCKLIEENIIEAYLADVYETEPPDKNDEFFNQVKNNSLFHEKIIFSPHSASHTVESRKEMRTKAARSILTFFRDGQIKNCVNYNLIQGK